MGQALQDLLGVAEGGTQGETLAVVAGQLGECGKGPLGREFGGPREMQRPPGGLVVGAGSGDLHQGVEMRSGFVGEFVADARRRHAAGLPQEQGAAQLPLQRADL